MRRVRSRVNERFRKAFDSLGWRALGILEGDEMIWFWIGSHAEYDRLVEQMRRK